MLAKNNNATPRPVGSGAVCSVADVNNPKVPSDPINSRAAFRCVRDKTPRKK